MPQESTPSFAQLLLWTLQAIKEKGGGATSKEIRDHIAQHNEIDPNFLEGDKFERWLGTCRYMARGAKWIISEPMPNTNRKRYRLLPDGEDVLSQSPEEALQRCRELMSTPFGQARKSDDDPDPGDPAPAPSRPTGTGPRGPQNGSSAQAADSVEPGDEPWRERLIGRLLDLNNFGNSGLAFEWFVIELLREYGLELRHTGRPGDDGIDAVGRAPISDIFTVQVVIQCKCVSATTATSRAEVAQLQSDAARQGAERAIFVTLGRFRKGARDAADSAVPNLELIDGEQLVDMMINKRFCVVETSSGAEESWSISEDALRALLSRALDGAIQETERAIRQHDQASNALAQRLKSLKNLRNS